MVRRLRSLQFVLVGSAAVLKLLAGNLAKLLTDLLYLDVLLNAETLINEGQKVKDSEACGLRGVGSELANTRVFAILHSLVSLA